jgi:hypothetical protein
MAATENIHGLSRNIPTDIKRTVRKRDGFGCVVCGSGLIEYEHIDPEFKDATVHEVKGITLLCPQCHAKKTRGFLSSETIKAAMKNPKCQEVGFSKEILDVGNGYPTLIFAGNTFKEINVPIMIAGYPVIVIDPPESEGAPFRLSAFFNDSLGKNALNIIENEWQAMADNWDVTVEGGRITIRDSDNEIQLMLEQTNRDTITVQKIKMVLANRMIVGEGNDLEIINLDTQQSMVVISGCHFSHGHVGLNL